jgi:hypothetical protein
LRRWIVLALAKLWENYEEAKLAAIKENAQEKLCHLLQDPCPEVCSNMCFVHIFLLLTDLLFFTFTDECLCL